MDYAIAGMKLSTVWLIIVLVLAYNGHLMTGALFAFPWFFHRQWEKTLPRRVRTRRREEFARMS